MERPLKTLGSLTLYLDNGFTFLAQIHLPDGRVVGFIPIDGKMFIREMSKMNKPLISNITVDVKSKLIIIYQDS